MKVGIVSWLFDLDNIILLLTFLFFLFLPTQFGKHFWPDESFVSGLRIDYLSPTLYGTDILILLLAIVVSLRMFLRKNSFSLSSKVLLFFLILSLVFLGQAFTVPRPLLLVFGIIKLSEFVFVGFFFKHFFQTKIQWMVLLGGLAIGVVVESILALAQFIHQGSLNGIFYYFGERTFTAQTPGIANASLNGELLLRPYGTFSHPNVLAGFFLLSLLLFLPFLTLRLRYLMSGVLLLGTAALFLTLSRVAILVWVSSFFVWFLRIQAFRSSILFLGGLLFFLLTFGSRFGFSFQEEAVVIRKDLAIAALSMVSDFPLFGVGLSHFLVLLPEYYDFYSVLLHLQPVHNIFLFLAAELGLVGFSLFCWFVWQTYQRLWQYRFFLQTKVVLLALTAVFVIGLFDHYWVTLQQGQLLFAFLLGISWSKSVTRPWYNTNT